MFKVPGVIIVAAWIVKLVFFLVPLQWLVAAICITTGMSQKAASVTARFIKSPTGIQQALHMAKDEMEIVKEDLWSEDVWGRDTTGEPKSALPLVLYYGKQVDAMLFSVAIT